MPDALVRGGLVCLSSGLTDAGFAEATCHVAGGAGALCNQGAHGAMMGCSKGFYCKAGPAGQPVTAACAAVGGLGAACLGSVQCEDGLYCKGWQEPNLMQPNRPIVEGLCTPWLDVGAACSTTDSASGCPTDMTCDGPGSRHDVSAAGGTPKLTETRRRLHHPPIGRFAPSMAGQGAASWS